MSNKNKTYEIDLSGPFPLEFITELLNKSKYALIQERVIKSAGLDYEITIKSLFGKVPFYRKVRWVKP